MLKLTTCICAIALLALLALPHSPLFATLPSPTQGGRKAKPKFIETVAGEIPTEWGELHSVVPSGTKGFSLVFRNKKEQLRIITLKGQQLPNTVTVINRKY